MTSYMQRAFYAEAENRRLRRELEELNAWKAHLLEALDLKNNPRRVGKLAARMVELRTGSPFPIDDLLEGLPPDE